MSDDQRLYSIVFMGAEIRLFRAGPECFLTMLSKTASNMLERAGAFGPFAFYCRPIDGDMYEMFAEELY
jgi:hypothetical protein